MNKYKSHLKKYYTYHLDFQKNLNKLDTYHEPPFFFSLIELR